MIVLANDTAVVQSHPPSLEDVHTTVSPHSPHSLQKLIADLQRKETSLTERVASQRAAAAAYEVPFSVKSRGFFYLTDYELPILMLLPHKFEFEDTLLFAQPLLNPCGHPPLGNRIFPRETTSFVVPTPSAWALTHPSSPEWTGVFFFGCGFEWMGRDVGQLSNSR